MITKTEDKISKKILDPVSVLGKTCLFALLSRHRNSNLIALSRRNIQFFKNTSGSIAHPVCPTYGSKQKSVFELMIRLILIVRE